MNITVDRCIENITGVIHVGASSHQRYEVFPLYRLSSYWSSFFGAIMTISLGLVLSLATGGLRSYEKNLHLTSPLFLKLWRNLRLLPTSEAETSLHVKKRAPREDARALAHIERQSKVSPRKQVKNQDESLQLFCSASPQESAL
ncbi:hypothetical protein IscW_ISCW014387 [Ixodes scapularis]|uniref:Uncharacterized protein n=1 Tax=Ixodes scapularis TaxID=6945 RepID=B7QKK1_IXOSC|nr:hypothetical protein IscW_ISCW014387 [Ixodes scapularis]|eukprot:XP_002415706.1 hypothetical protein IscW_ISCW014387 [Ixodes scapularis]